MKCESCEKEIEKPKEWEIDNDLCTHCIFEQYGGEIKALYEEKRKAEREVHPR